MFSSVKDFMDKKAQEMEALSRQYITPNDDNTFMMGYERYNDPLALKISWKPHNPSMREQMPTRLFSVNPSKIKSKASLTAYFMSILFLVIALYGCYDFFHSFKFERLFGAIAFFAAGVFMIHLNSYSVTFDLESGYFTAGDKIQRRLKDIHALQVLQRAKHEEDSSHYENQLLLVFNNGSRQFVCENSKRKHLLNDAQILSSFLNNVPIWDELS